MRLDQFNAPVSSQYLRCCLPSTPRPSQLDHLPAIDHHAMLSLFSKIATRLSAGSRSVQPSTVRPISIFCRGQSDFLHTLQQLTLRLDALITEEELFEYNNGRFLVDEQQQYSKRYVKFNVQKLCEKVSAITEHGAPVCKIDKMEGGFSKALLMTTEDGAEVVAKIPNPTAGRAKYSTASEAAVLQYREQSFLVHLGSR